MKEGGAKERRTLEIEDDIPQRNLLRQDATRRLRGERDIRDDGDDFQFRRPLGLDIPYPPLLGMTREDKRSDDRGRHIVGMSFQFVGVGEQLLLAEHTPGHCFKGRQSGDDGRSASAKPARDRNVILDPEAYLGDSNPFSLPSEVHRAEDQVALVCGNECSIYTLHHHFVRRRARLPFLHANLQIHAQRQS